MATETLKTNKTRRADKPTKTWGRDHDVSYATVFICALILLFCPLMVIYFWLSCEHFQCSLLEPMVVFHSSMPTLHRWELWLLSLKTFAMNYFPKPSQIGFQMWFGWLLFQALLYTFLPGKIGYGQLTPAGHVLPYKVNGLFAWIVSHIMFVMASMVLGAFSPSVIADHWGALLVAANAYGYFLASFSYIKAYLFPSHPEDRKFSSSALYDLFMGIEFNPRLGEMFDFKLFHNSRPGIVAWTLINLSFAAKQYHALGYVTNSMVIVNFLQAIYVLDFFYNEDWYLRTIDIAHDHFGFYLAWGDSVWLPWMYTLQAQYLFHNPLDLSFVNAALILGLGLAGYGVFRITNDQKDICRTTDGKCNIWGKPAKVIRTQFTTSDGKTHQSLLLASGFWGWSRHFNYVGDLMGCWAYSLACGFQHLLPWFYVIYMTILLVHRSQRDETRCSGKYGKYWDEYKKLVPWKIVPYVY